MLALRCILYVTGWFHFLANIYTLPTVIVFSKLELLFRKELDNISSFYRGKVIKSIDHF